MSETTEKQLELQIVQKDRDSLYMGNLNTVEFDLNLPRKGRYGSDITWKSGHERFISENGKVTRPTYGMGDRLVPLYATFRYGEAVAEKTYEVRILEETNKLKVDIVYPVYLTAEVNEEAYLPQAGIIKTQDGDTIPHPLQWEDAGKICFEKAGRYQKEGFVAGTSYKVKAEITVVEKKEIPYKEKTPAVTDCQKAEIRLLEGSPFYEAQERMHKFLLSVNDDQMLYNFRQASGLDTKGAPVMEGWDSPDSQLKGHTTGHYMSALALCYRATGDERIKEKAAYMVDAMAECQDAFSKIEGIRPGFLSGYSEEQFDLLEKYTVYPIIWAPYYTLHKILAGLLDCYKFLPSQKALEIACKLGTWTWNRLSRLPREQRTRMWSMYIAGEFGGMNEVMAELYEITGREEFLKCARLFDNDKLFYPLEQRVDAISTIHANQHIPQILGAMEIFKASGEKRYYDIAERFWNFITASRIFANGGTGEGEMFHEAYKIAGLLNENTEESCASYNMLKLTKELFQYDPKTEYMDYYENTVTNHILSTLDKKVTGESTYFLPLGPGMRKEFLYENHCCHGTGMESHFKYIECIYFHEKDSIGINLFISSNLVWKEKEIYVNITTYGNNPERIRVFVKGNLKTVKIRKPAWVRDYRVVVDGHIIECIIDEKGYLQISRDFSQGCNLELEFPYYFEIHRTADDLEKASVSYGPYVLAALSEKNEFIMVSFSEEDIERKMRRVGDSLTFECDGIRWIPLYQLDEEAYHVYVECPQCQRS